MTKDITDTKILKKAIERAVENGFSSKQVGSSPHQIELYVEDALYYNDNNYFGVIFSIPFAKAFWGEEMLPFDYDHDESPSIENWKRHLQQMVLEDEPLQYLRRFL